MTDDTCMVSYEIYPIQKKYYFWRFLLFRKKEIDQGYYCHKVGSQIETWMLNVILPLSECLLVGILCVSNGIGAPLLLLLVSYTGIFLTTCLFLAVSLLYFVIDMATSLSMIILTWLLVLRGGSYSQKQHLEWKWCVYQRFTCVNVIIPERINKGH